MYQLLKNTSNSIWHAFYALQYDNQPNTGFVAKSKLKVLTANIGTLMNLHGIEKGLDDFRSTPSLNFEQYMYYLQEEVFSSLPDSTTLQKYRRLEEEIDEICWLVCRKNYLTREQPIFNDNSVYQLFRIFCLLAEMEADPLDASYLVTLHSDELARVASQLVTSLGIYWDDVDFAALSASIKRFRFPIFLAILETKYSGESDLNESRDINGLTEAVDDLYDTYVKDVIKKGYLTRKGGLLPMQKSFWYVLRPGELSSYKDYKKKEPCDVVILDAGTQVNAVINSDKLPERRFVINGTEQKTIELSANDHKGRLQWIAAIQTAAKHAGEKISYQRGMAHERRSTRQAVKQEKEETKLELHNERQARLAAENQAKMLEELSKQEYAQLLELRNAKDKLEILLQEEKEAHRDEEIVRKLQARHLREEWERRENLEKLQREQQELLELEKFKRMEFEMKQQDNEKQLQEAELRLQKLENERQKLNEELKMAREKINEVEERRLLIYEAKIAANRRSHNCLSPKIDKSLVTNKRC